MFEKLVIPQNTRFEERNIVVDGDVIVGANSKIDYGIIARKILIGERSTVNGDVFGEEVRIDALCNVKGNVTSKGDAYIGGFVSIDGKLTVYGDLEIGRNVRIKRGFEAKGLITIEDPLPILIFILLYLMYLLNIKRFEEVEEIFKEVEQFESPLIVPENSVLALDRIETSKPVEISGSRVLGNIKAEDVFIYQSEVFGSVRGRDITIDRSRVHGAVEGREVYILNSSEVFGYIKAEKIYMEEGCIVEGGMIGKRGVWIKQRGAIHDLGERDVQKDVS